MEFFKKRAREILTSSNEMEYEGVPMPLSGAYKALKQAIKNPSILYSQADEKPGYMKMTFSQGRQAPAGQKILELTKAANKKDQGESAMVKNVQTLSGKYGSNPLLLQMKDKDNKFLDGVFGKQKIKTKKEMDRDKKVEALLQAYKRQDEDTMKKEHMREETKRQN